MLGKKKREEKKIFEIEINIILNYKEGLSSLTRQQNICSVDLKPPSPRKTNLWQYVVEEIGESVKEEVTEAKQKRGVKS